MKAPLLCVLAVAIVTNVVSTLQARHHVAQALEHVNACRAKLEKAEDRLWEIDCSAPLRPNRPFGGMGIWRATHCPTTP